MPNYRFRLVDATTVSDQGEQSFEQDKQAALAATDMARDLAITRPEFQNRGFKILVIDQSGEEIHLAPLDPVKSL